MLQCKSAVMNCWNGKMIQSAKLSAIDAVYTDFDGTLTSEAGNIPDANIDTLHKLRRSGIKTILATGRNLFSISRALADRELFDYVIFSSGAGIIDWKTKNIVKSSELDKSEIESTINLLQSNKIDFMIHKVIPDNHNFYYSKNAKDNADFYRRIEHYNDFATPLGADMIFETASQLLAVIPPERSHLAVSLMETEIDVSVIRATSPMDSESIWLEFFPRGVSKGGAAEWLAAFTGHTSARSFAIGNDYNDIALLEWAGISVVVKNAPTELKKRFKSTKSNHQNGFSVAVERYIYHNRHMTND
jgi:Cof subfamily protein (haloacid dehalogenase superfamily)